MHQSSSPQCVDRKRSTLDAACIDVRKPRDGGPIVEDTSEKRHSSMKAHRGINHSMLRSRKALKVTGSHNEGRVCGVLGRDDDAF